MAVMGQMSLLFIWVGRFIVLLMSEQFVSVSVVFFSARAPFVMLRWTGVHVPGYGGHLWSGAQVWALRTARRPQVGLQSGRGLAGRSAGPLVLSAGSCRFCCFATARCCYCRVLWCQVVIVFICAGKLYCGCLIFCYMLSATLFVYIFICHLT